MRLARLLAIIALLPALLLPCAVRVCVCLGETPSAPSCCQHCCGEGTADSQPPADRPHPGDPVARSITDADADCCLTFARGTAPLAGEPRPVQVAPAAVVDSEPTALPGPLALPLASARLICPAPPGVGTPPLLHGAGLPLVV